MGRDLAMSDPDNLPDEADTSRRKFLTAATAATARKRHKCT
jgi:hypothetical protein